MKKILLLLSACFILFSVVTTCTKKAKDQPVIVFNNGDTIVSVNEGDKQEVLVNINAPGQLEEISFFYSSLLDTVKTLIGEPIVNFAKPKRYSSKVVVDGRAENYLFVVKAKDKGNKTVFANLLVQTATPLSKTPPQPEVVKDSPKSSTATHSHVSDHHTALTPLIPIIPSNKKGQFIAGFNRNSVGSSLSIGNLQNKNAIQKLTEAKQHQEQIDLMFFYGKENGVTIASPAHDLVNKVFNHQQYGTPTWTTKKVTFLTKLQSSVTFNQLTIQDAENTFDADNSEKIALNHLKENDILFFQTEKGLLGAIQIKYIGENNQSVISFDVKILTEGDSEVSEDVTEIEIIEDTPIDVTDQYVEDPTEEDEVIETVEDGEEIVEEEIIEENQTEVSDNESFQGGSSVKFDEVSFVYPYDNEDSINNNLKITSSFRSFLS